MAYARQGDVAKARELLDKACRSGEEQACTWLASLPKPK
jgi:pentatricopeptide repeat protein